MNLTFLYSYIPDLNKMVATLESKAELKLKQDKKVKFQAFGLSYFSVEI